MQVSNTLPVLGISLSNITPLEDLSKKSNYIPRTQGLDIVYSA